MDMRFERLNERCFDVDASKANEVVMTCSADGSSIQFKMQDLVEYPTLAKNISSSELSCIQTGLGFEIIDFDGEKIFLGRKKGLRLYGFLKNDVAREIFLFSCGEFQPGRFQVFLEGHLKY